MYDVLINIILILLVIVVCLLTAMVSKLFWDEMRRK